jgi:hypothetical protein
MAGLVISFSLAVATGRAALVGRELKELRVAYPPSMASVTLMTAIKQ